MPWLVWINGRQFSPSMGHPPRLMATFPVKAGWNEMLFKFVRRHPRTTLEMVLDSNGSEPIQWYATPSEGSEPGHVRVAGPYGEGIRPDQMMQTLRTSYDIEKLVLQRQPGTPVKIPGKEAKLARPPGI